MINTIFVKAIFQYDYLNIRQHLSNVRMKFISEPQESQLISNTFIGLETQNCF